MYWSLETTFTKWKLFLENLSLIINSLLACQANLSIWKLHDDWRFQHDYWEQKLEVFLNLFGLECLIKKPTCFQSKNSSCIDLILKNKKDLFRNSNVLEVRISDHHFHHDHLEKSARQRKRKNKIIPWLQWI